jgi:polyisoprenoid-binding protein YceI
METIEVMSTTKWHIIHALSEIGFKIKHLMLSDVRGLFKDYNASIYLTGGDPVTAEIDVWINPASINTGNEARDAHLRSANFLDTENFKEINFIGNTIEKINEDHYALYGDLTIKRVTKRIKLDVEFIGTANGHCGDTRASFFITGKISRKDFGLTYNGLLDVSSVVVSDEVFINCEIELAKKS